MFRVVFLSIDISWHYKLSQRANAAKIQQEELDRKDIFRHLKGEMNYQLDDDPMRFEFSYVNGADLPIVITDICALSKGFNAAEEIYFPGAHLCMYSLDESHRIRD